MKFILEARMCYHGPGVQIQATQRLYANAKEFDEIFLVRV